MAKKKTTTGYTDGPYFLKLILYVIVGSQWLWISTENSDLPLPVGFIVGLIFASHDHFKIDRKIEYAVLIVAALIAYWAQIGIYINL